MWIAAQAVAEYGGLTSSGAARSSSFDGLVNQVMNASPTDYVLAVIALIVVMYLISKLMDAA